MKHLGDITKIKGNDAPVVDCVIGGSPCQDLSLAGKRAGLAGARSGLYMEQIRIIKEMRQADALHGNTDVDVRPRYMVWENVPGAFSTNGGQDFAAVLEEAIRVAEPEAPGVDVPEKGWPTSGCFYDEMGKWSVAWRVLDAQFWGVPQRRRRIALVADFGGLSASEVLFVKSCVSGNSQSGKPKGKAAPKDVGECSGGTEQRVISVDQGGGKSGAHTYEGVAPTLTCTHGGEPAVAYTYDARGNGDGQISCTITGGHQSSISDYTAVVIEPVTYQRVTGPLMANSHPGSYTGQDAFSDMLIAGPVEHQENRVRYIVRRLSPLECERLQGFPDNWTKIGDWVDSKGKKHKEADSPRYKALGNSIALPPWKWVLKRLCACYERDATMASLFDGIGGFPLIWEQLNGKGSCLWASEIEEFPMAVTKLRFGE